MRVLILAGSGEAAGLAEACARQPGLEVISSLAGRTAAPRALPGAVRVGGFGGAAGLEEFLRARGVDRLVDASHPFAAQISRNAAVACRASGVPRLRLLRPPWPKQPGDRWHEVDDLAAAAALLPQIGRRAFLTVGHKELAAFAGLERTWLLIRTIEAAAGVPPERALCLQARGPFASGDEVALMRRHRIDVLVTKASGGEATYAKLAAARSLGLPVIMVRRPPPPAGPVVSSVSAALAWLRRR